MPKRKRVKEEQKMHHGTKLRVVVQPDDGLCGYHCMVYALSHRSGKMQNYNEADVREQLGDEIKNNSEM